MKCLTVPSTFSGDDANEGSVELSQATPQRSERSHMIIWQNPTPSVPSPALWHLTSSPSSALLEWDKEGADIHCTPAKLETTWEMVLSWNWINQPLSVAAIKVSSKYILCMICAVTSLFTSFILNIYLLTGYFWWMLMPFFVPSSDFISFL